MQIIYRAENLIDAHLVRGRLASEGIDAFVQGEYLAGAMGELPVAGLLAVAVQDDNVEPALSLIQQWQQEAEAFDESPERDEDADGEIDDDAPHAFLA